MTDNLLSGGGSGWDQTLISSNPFEPEPSPSPIVSPANNETSKAKSNSSNKNNRNKNKETLRKKSNESSSNVKKANSSNNSQTILDFDSNNNNNSSKQTNDEIDDILGMFEPSTTINTNTNNNNTSMNASMNASTNANATRSSNNANMNDNPFLAFDDNPFSSNNSNNNMNNNNNNGNGVSSFDFFEPGSSNVNNNNNNNNNSNSKNNKNTSKGALKVDNKNKSKAVKNDDDDDDDDDDDSKSDYSTESSIVSSSSDESDEEEGTDNSNKNSMKSAKSNMNSGSGTAIAPPKRSSRRVVKAGQNDQKRHSAPVTDIESVSNKLKSEGLIQERKIGVDPRSPGVGQRIRNEKYEKEKAAAKEKNESNNKNNNNNNNNNKAKLYEVLPELKRGTALLKYGRHGYPHFRQFNLSEDNSALRWFSSKKKLGKSEILMKDIHDVITGQHTKEFERIKWTTLTPASFSIIYGDQKRSLNLVAKSVDEMKMWVESLRYLRNEAKKGCDLSKIKSVMVPVDFRDRNRPQSRKHSGNFLRSHETKEKEINNELKVKLINDLTVLRNLYRDIEKEANNEVVQASSEFSSISQILSEIEERIGELDKEVRNTRNTKIAENDVWRTKIDLESLREKIRVLYKNNKTQFKKNKSRRWSVF